MADAEQYELMQIAYEKVGINWYGNDDLIGAEYIKLQKLEKVPERWPLARLSFSLQTCVDHLDRVFSRLLLGSSFRPHGLTPQNRCHPFNKWRNV